MKRLDSGTLDALEKVAKSGRELHPVDAQRLIDEVRAYKTWFEFQCQVSGNDPEKLWTEPNRSPGVTGSESEPERAWPSIQMHSVPIHTVVRVEVPVEAHVPDPAPPEPVGEVTFTVGPDGVVKVTDRGTEYRDLSPPKYERDPNRYGRTSPVTPDFNPPPVSSKEGSGAEPDVTVTEPK